MNQFEQPILILDDNKAVASVLGKYCQEIGFGYKIAKEGKEGLNLAKEQTFSIYIVDLNMPIMDGKSFIKEIQNIYPEAVIIVQTSHSEPKTIIEIMKQNVFDYILKPTDPEIFKQVLLKAKEHKHLVDIKNQQYLNAEKKLQGQIDWLLYKETLLVKDQVKKNTSPILNLHTSLNSGAGLGTLVTLLDMVATSAEKKADKYIVDAEYLELIFENSKYCKKQIESLSEFSKILNTKIELKPFSSIHLLEKIHNLKNSLTTLFEKKDIELILPNEIKNCNLMIDESMLLESIQEVLINAYKYSPSKSKIYLLINIKEGYFWICFKNNIQENSGFEIPVEYEKLVTEPFFRLARIVDESVIDVEKFSIGLGLTVVDFIMKKHNGLFFIHEVTDHTLQLPSQSVLAELLLPFQLK